MAEVFAKSEIYQTAYHFNHTNITTPEKTIDIFLWFAANESYSYRNMSDRFNVSTSTIHNAILRGTAFFSNLSNRIIKWPTIEQMQEEARIRERESRIPGIIGKLKHTSW